MANQQRTKGIHVDFFNKCADPSPGVDLRAASALKVDLHRIISCPTDWELSRRDFMLDVDTWPMVGVCVRTGAGLIGKDVANRARRTQILTTTTFLGTVSIFILPGNVWTFPMQEGTLPKEVDFVLTSHTVAKLGYGARRGLGKLYARSVLSTRPQGIFDIEQAVKSHWKFAPPLYLRFDRNKQMTVARNNNGCEQSRRIRGLEKLVLLTTHEDMFLYDRHRTAFNQAFFDSDYGDYVSNLYRNASARQHLVVASCQALYTTLLARHGEIMSYREQHSRGAPPALFPLPTVFGRALTYFNVRPGLGRFDKSDYQLAGLG